MFFCSNFLVLFGLLFPVAGWEFINFLVFAVQEYRLDFACARGYLSLMLLFDQLLWMISLIKEPLLILFLVDFIFDLKRLIDLLDLFSLADLSLGKSA